MSSINRPLSGKALHFRLDAEEREKLIDAELLERAGRSARTLVKDGPLRVTLVALGPGGELAEHQVDGPITVQVLTGEVRLDAGEDVWNLTADDFLSVGAGVPHTVSSTSGGVFLLTVTNLT